MFGKTKKVRFRSVAYWENTLFSSATVGIIFGTGSIVIGFYLDNVELVRIGILISFAGFAGMVYAQYKIDQARDLNAYIAGLLNKKGKFMGNPKKLKALKELHAIQMEQKAQEEKERYLEEKSKNKKLLDAEKRYEKRVFELMSEQERRRRAAEQEALLQQQEQD
ncbi:MAG: hypothetical protein LBU89_08025 [Fibromonadaceae bacterium]|nr:hypothetical protein [Fibromonadaceae bacterium]